MSDLERILALGWRIVNIDVIKGRFNATSVKTGHNTVVHGNGATVYQCLVELRGAVEMLEASGRRTDDGDGDADGS